MLTSFQSPGCDMLWLWSVLIIWIHSPRHTVLIIQQHKEVALGCYLVGKENRYWCWTLVKQRIAFITHWHLFTTQNLDKNTFWRTTADVSPLSRQELAVNRLVWLLPHSTLQSSNCIAFPRPLSVSAKHAHSNVYITVRIQFKKEKTCFQLFPYQLDHAT